jgi:hypothetical protein
MRPHAERGRACALAATSAVAASVTQRKPAMSEHETKQDQETWPQKAKRLNVSSKTLDRWAEAGRISKPTKINKRKYGPAGEMPQADVAE